MLPIRSTHGRGTEILPQKQMLQRWLISLAQAKVGNTSKKLLNETRQKNRTKKPIPNKKTSKNMHNNSIKSL